jgi:hypothetical protein
MAWTKVPQPLTPTEPRFLFLWWTLRPAVSTEKIQKLDMVARTIERGSVKLKMLRNESKRINNCLTHPLRIADWQFKIEAD